MSTSPDRRSIWLKGRPTSITVEPPIWDGLRAIAAKRNIPIARLIAEIDRTRGVAPYSRFRNLSSAVRMFVFEHKPRGL